MKATLALLLSIIQILCIIEGWISYFLHCIVKMLASIIFPLAIICFIWWPLDMLSGICWSCCEYTKFKLRGIDIEFREALSLYTQHYPQL